MSPVMTCTGTPFFHVCAHLRIWTNAIFSCLRTFVHIESIIDIAIFHVCSHLCILSLLLIRSFFHVCAHLRLLISPCFNFCACRMHHCPLPATLRSLANPPCPMLPNTPTKRPSSKGPATKGPATKCPATKGPGYERSGCKRCGRKGPDAKGPDSFIKKNYSKI
jgi:hypothetical protein